VDVHPRFRPLATRTPPMRPATERS
jgi:hypothetical protein